MKYAVFNRFSGQEQFTAEIETTCKIRAVHLGLAVKWAVAHGVSLIEANLYGADLYGADLSEAHLRGAHLRGADLRGADLRGADLRGADLRGADLYGADLRGADLYGAARTRILPDGEVIGWKKCRDRKIVKLKIPTDARRSHAFGRKCRAEFADVLEVVGGGTAISYHDSSVTYAAGARVYCHMWSEDWREECAGGIHFFITREEAEAYQ